MNLDHLKHVEISKIPLAMFFIVMLLYVSILFIRTEIFRQALYVWGAFFLFFLPFVLAIIGLLGVFDAYISTEMVSKYLGDRHKIHGYLFALLFGSIVSVSQYAIFPTIKLLKKKGARTAILATFMVAWSGMSLPLIPLEAEIFGPKFALVRLSVVAIGAVIFGFITGMLKVHIGP